jgi:hypothetical protein
MEDLACRFFLKKAPAVTPLYNRYKLWKLGRLNVDALDVVRATRM